MLASYETYTYMKKRWEKYIRKQGTEDISGGTISNSNKSESAGGSSESSSTGGESSGESDTTQQISDVR